MNKIIIILSTCLVFTFFLSREGVAMDARTIDNVTTFCAGSLIAVESSLLLFGMNYPHVSSWSNVKNISFAVSDIAMGSVLAYYALSGKTYMNNWFYYVVCTLLMITHSFREYEYLSQGNTPFAANLPLFVLNNIRFALVGASMGLSFTFKF